MKGALAAVCGWRGTLVGSGDSIDGKAARSGQSKGEWLAPSVIYTVAGCNSWPVGVGPGYTESTMRQVDIRTHLLSHRDVSTPTLGVRLLVAMLVAGVALASCAQVPSSGGLANPSFEEWNGGLAGWHVDAKSPLKGAMDKDTAGFSMSAPREPMKGPPTQRADIVRTLPSDHINRS